MKPEELSQSHLLSAVDGARIVYFDGRLYETAFLVAKEVCDITLFVQVSVFANDSSVIWFCNILTPPSSLSLKAMHFSFI